MALNKTPERIFEILERVNVEFFTIKLSPDFGATRQFYSTKFEPRFLKSSL